METLMSVKSSADYNNYRRQLHSKIHDKKSTTWSPHIELTDNTDTIDIQENIIW